jgi:hypothetical protein
VAIVLGKDATVSVGGSVVGVRNVSLSSSARTIDVEEYGTRDVTVYQTGKDATLSMEINDDTSISTLFTALNNGSVGTITATPGGWSFSAVITNISQNAAIDGVVTWQVEARMTRSGLR